MSVVEINIWNAIQSGLTATFLAFYPFTVFLLYQIQHEMASNPWKFQIRKILVTTCLMFQLVIFTFLRDQYIWNEQINEEDEIPNVLLCKLSRFLHYGIIEMLTYYLIIMIIWDETEAQNISTHQLNPKIIESIKAKSEDKRFLFSTLFKMYTFITALATLIPSSVIPNPFSDHFLDGIDSNYRCQISNIANIISIINKAIFLFFVLCSAVHLRKIETIHHYTNTIAFLIIIPICILSNIFVTMNEFLLHILSLDNARKTGFVSTLVFTVAMTCNHIMMQAQATTKIMSGARRCSALLVQAGNSARQSLMATRESIIQSLGNNNKIGIDTIIEVSHESSSVSQVHTQRKPKFSFTEITEDEYDSVLIKQDITESIKLAPNEIDTDHEDLVSNSDEARDALTDTDKEQSITVDDNEKENEHVEQEQNQELPTYDNNDQDIDNA